MDIRLLPEHERFRDDVRRFLDGALDDDLRDGARFCPGVFQDYETNIRWHRILFKQGWVAPSWPKQYGGTGWDQMRRHIWAREARLRERRGCADGSSHGGARDDWARTRGHRSICRVFFLARTIGAKAIRSRAQVPISRR